MKKLFILLALAGAMPMQSMAQDDDLYFVPNKSEKTGKTVKSEEVPAYYRGSNRAVDEYNRVGKFRSYYQKIGKDSIGNDIITFERGGGVYPDSTYIDTLFMSPNYMAYDESDFDYSRRMSRWDGFYDPWLHRHGPWGYRGWYGGWYNPWGYGYGGYYDPWYSSYYGGWYDPWYYGYGGWYSPWNYGYAGWYGPYYGGWYGGFGWPYYGRGAYYTYSGGNPRGLSGNRTWTYSNDRGTATAGSFGRGRYAGTNRSASTYTSSSRSNRSFGGRINSVTPSNSNRNNSFGNSTRSTPTYNSGSFGGGTFGGGGSTGGSFGGGRSGGGNSGGGGHFGGGRR